MRVSEYISHDGIEYLVRLVLVKADLGVAGSSFWDYENVEILHELDDLYVKDHLQEWLSELLINRAIAIARSEGVDA